MIIQGNEDHEYRSTVLRFLDDLTNAVEKVNFRAICREIPLRAVFKMLSRATSRTIAVYLSGFNSEDVNVHNDLYRYSSKFSSVISENSNVLKDLVKV